MSYDLLKKSINSLEQEENIEIRYCNLHVQELYYSHKELFSKYSVNLNVDHEKKEHYIYAWRTKTLPHKYFYIGKGTGTRYDHIENEIREYEQGKKNNKRSEYYYHIKKIHGIEYVFLERDISDYEAVICELCYIHDYLKNGEYLLNSHYVPDDKLASWLKGEQCVLDNQRIIGSEIYNHYIADTVLEFDEVSTNYLKRTFLHKYFLEIENEEKAFEYKRFIQHYIENVGGKIYKSISTKTTSVIVFGGISVEKFVLLKKEGKMVYRVTDVIAYIKEQGFANFPEDNAYINPLFFYGITNEEYEVACYIRQLILKSNDKCYFRISKSLEGIISLGTGGYAIGYKITSRRKYVIIDKDFLIERGLSFIQGNKAENISALPGKEHVRFCFNVLTDLNILEHYFDRQHLSSLMSGSFERNNSDNYGYEF